jgi:hypothetical protein
MGKSIRSKVMKRFRTVKRQYISATTDLDRMKESNRKCMMIASGQHLEVKPTVNAFRHPNLMDAEIPKVIVAKSTDFRSEALPNAGYAPCRNQRKNKKSGSTVVLATTVLSEQTMEI